MSQNQSQDIGLRRFWAIGMIIALLEEFISQGVLKRNLIGWIIPTFVAFLPFLVGAAMIHRYLGKKVTSANRIELAFYGISGTIGLMVEWFLIGLSPWNSSNANPLLTIVFQLAIFSFWGTVAFAPRIILDNRALVKGLVRWFKRFLAAGFIVIYLATLSSNRSTQFVVGIFSIMTVFLFLNIFYLKYIRSWSPHFQHGNSSH